MKREFPSTGKSLKQHLRTTMDNSEFEKRFEEIEARLIAQEHRPIAVIKTYFQRKKWAKEDKRRTAAKTAIVWRLFFSPGTMAATGGIIALISLLVLVWQNGIISEQNLIIEKQNQFFQQQIRLEQEHFDLQRITELITTLYDGSLEPPVKSRAFEEFYTLEESSIKVGELENWYDSFISKDSGRARIRNGMFIQYLGSTFQNTNPISLKACDFKGIDVSVDSLVGVDFSTCNFSNSNWNSFSKESGYQQIRYCNFDECQFDSASFFAIEFYRCSFQEADFSRSNSSGVKFIESEFSNTRFDSAYMFRSKFDSCLLDQVSFRGLGLSRFNWMDNNIVDSSFFEGCKFLYSEFNIDPETFCRKTTGDIICRDSATWVGLESLRTFGCPQRIEFMPFNPY